jgi:DNA polymerase epsilon subunit 3
MAEKVTKESEPQPQADQAQDKPAAASAPLMEAEVEELPKAIVRRLVKNKLANIAGGEGAEVIVNKDAMSAFAESTRIFIHYLSATYVPPPPPPRRTFTRSSFSPVWLWNMGEETINLSVYE